MELVYVTSIIRTSTGEKVYIMIDKETKQKYLSRSREEYIPYEDSELSSILNKEDQYEISTGNLKKLLAVEGAVCIVVLTIAGNYFFNDLSKTNIDYVLRREVPGYTRIKNIDYNNFEELSNEFSRNVSINSYYNDTEAFVLQNGGSTYLTDWAYLYSEEEMDDLLYGIRSFKIDREADLDNSVVGTYYKGMIQIKEGHHNTITTTHEVAHGMFNHSKNARKNLRHGFERAICEAFASTINHHYFEPYADFGEVEDSYMYQRRMLYKLSLIIDDNEAVMKRQITQEGMMGLVCDVCPNIPKEDILRFFSLLDTSIVLELNKDYKLESETKDELNDLFKRMYADRFNHKLPGDIVIISDDFLSDEISFYRESNPCVYTMYRHEFNNITDFDSIDHTNIVGYVSGSVEPYLLLCTKKERDEFQKDGECIDFLYEKYSDNKEDLNKFLQCLLLKEEDFKPYFELYIDSLNKRGLSSERFINELSLGIETFFDSCVTAEDDGIKADDSYRAIYYNMLEDILVEKCSSTDTIFDFYLRFDNSLRLDNKTDSINQTK